MQKKSKSCSEMRHALRYIYINVLVAVVAREILYFVIHNIKLYEVKFKSNKHTFTIVLHYKYSQINSNNTHSISDLKSTMCVHVEIPFENPINVNFLLMCKTHINCPISFFTD